MNTATAFTITAACIIAYAAIVYSLATMPAPQLTEATATQCSTDRECEFWADRMGGEF
jgi:hypothetical protein